MVAVAATAACRMLCGVVRPPRDLLPPPTPVTRTPSGTLPSTFGIRVVQRRQTGSDASSGSSARREGLQLRCQAKARNGGGLLAAVGVVPRGGGAEEQSRLLPKRRPKTQPDLLAGMRPAATASSSRSGSPDAESTGRRTPSKVLVSVSVQRSMWPLHVMASAVALYAKEGRRPPSDSTSRSSAWRVWKKARESWNWGPGASSSAPRLQLSVWPFLHPPPPMEQAGSSAGRHQGKQEKHRPG